MPLTPVELSSAELPRALRGYSIEATRALLDRAANELKAAISERDGLRDEVQRLESELAASRERGADGREKERLISEALVAATRTADQLREEGKRDGEAAVVEARTRAQELVAAAEAEAREKAHTLVEEAKAEGRRLEDEAERLEVDAERLRALTDQAAADLRSLLVGLLEKLETRADRPSEQYEETAPPMPLDELRSRAADRPDESIR
jgi:cell division septum initiation protein DivIVA